MGIEVVDPRARGLRPRREVQSVGLAGVVRRLDWLLMARARRRRRLRPLGDRRHHAPRRRAAPRSATRRCSRSPARSSSPSRCSSTRIAIGGCWRPIYFGTLGIMVLVLAAGAATRGSKRWIDVGFFTFQPSEFGKVLFVLALAGFLAERRNAIAAARTPLATIGLGVAPDPARLRPAGHRHGARLHGGARGGALRRRRPLVAPRGAAALATVVALAVSSGCCPRPG